MAYVVCAEEMERRWIAHVPDLPGCFVSHEERDTAINLSPKAVEGYVEWAEQHGLHVSGISGPMIVNEVVRAWQYEADYEVNAFFAADRPPLHPDELSEFERLLTATRSDLEAALEGIDPVDLEREIPDERWPILGVLNHIALAEQWFFDRMGIGLSTGELPGDTFERLIRVRENTLERLADLGRREGVVTLSGETWSARKVMRRTLWHERDHTQHIQKLRRKIGV